ncbi:hypothetical protein [Kushneria phosphatilytica]|uniref:hypothetical protein n=1 Tax=Kushneria phosphatilytica TaxID=657387 RepID=UPI0008DA5FAC|nr:hypothetical protein [Kushneria phosphatilytica]OHV12906.1 hypothetical protein BH688_02545 [Kushneria phosphatilytica]
MSRKTLAIVGTTFFMALGLAGCGGGDDQSDDQQQSGGNETSQSQQQSSQGTGSEQGGSTSDSMDNSDSASISRNRWVQVVPPVRCRMTPAPA